MRFTSGVQEWFTINKSCNVNTMKETSDVIMSTDTKQRLTKFNNYSR